MSVKQKSNAGKNTTLTQFKFKWWMAVIAIAVVAIIGIIVVQFSHASGKVYVDYVDHTCLVGTCTKTITLKSSGNWFISKVLDGRQVWYRNGGTCAIISYGSGKSSVDVSPAHIPSNGLPVTVNEISCP